MNTRGPADSSNEDPQRLGLREQLPEKAPPEWMDHNIRAMAQEQARVNAQRGAHVGSTEVVRPVRRQWLPWAGSLAGLAVVVLMVTGQPENVPQVASEAPVSMTPAVPSAPAVDNTQSVATPATLPAPIAASPPVTRNEVASTSGSSEPAAALKKSAPAASAREQEKRAPSNTASANKAETQAGAVLESPATTTRAASTPDAGPGASTAPSPPPAAPNVAAADPAVVPQVSVGSSVGSSVAPPAAAAGRVADSVRTARPEVMTQSAESDSRARQTPPATLAKRTRETPATTEACNRELEDDVRADRLTQARELYRLCREKFPEHVWSELVRERLGSQ